MESLKCHDEHNATTTKKFLHVVIVILIGSSWLVALPYSIVYPESLGLWLLTMSITAVLIFDYHRNGFPNFLDPSFKGNIHFRHIILGGLVPFVAWFFFVGLLVHPGTPILWIIILGLSFGFWWKTQPDQQHNTSHSQC